MLAKVIEPLRNALGTNARLISSVVVSCSVRSIY